MDKKMLLMNAIVSCTVSLASVYGYSQYFNKPKFVTIDLEGIIAKQKEAYRERLYHAITPQEMAALQNESSAFANSLYESVKVYAETNNVVVFQSTALLGGEARDITREVVEAYSTKKGE